MNETIFVVFVVIIIIFIGVIIFSGIQGESLQEKNKALRNSKAVEFAHRISFWSEITCSKEFSCLDIAKLMTLGDFINKSRQQDVYAFNYYFDLLRNSKIVVTPVYPVDEFDPEANHWVLWDNEGIKKSTDIVRVPVTLYNSFTSKSAMGIMELQIYE